MKRKVESDDQGKVEIPNGKKNKEENGKLDVDGMRKLINKNAGYNVSFNLMEEDPCKVVDWIDTGCHVLNCIIARGIASAGFPSGKCVEVCGLFSAGKSFLGASAAAHSQKKGYTVVWFDSESSADAAFLERIGINLEKLIYVQATSIEFVFEQMEELMKTNEKFFFVLDSLANTPVRLDEKNSEYDPLFSVAVKPRILGIAMRKLIQPLANTDSIFLILNQLKVNIPKSPIDAILNPYFAPGGNATKFASSLSVWLTARKGKDSFITDERGYKIGTEVKAKLEKSRFGTQFRECSFKILWADENPRFQEDDAWYEIASQNEAFTAPVGKAKGILKMPDGSEIKFYKNDWSEILKDEKVREWVKRIVEIEMVDKFVNKTGSSKFFYDVDSVEEISNEIQ